MVAYCAELSIREEAGLVLVAFHKLVEVVVHELKDDDDVLAELEAIKILYDVLATFHIFCAFGFL